VINLCQQQISALFDADLFKKNRTRHRNTSFLISHPIPFGEGTELVLSIVEGVKDSFPDIHSLNREKKKVEG
jgi:hypothetical protein